MDLMLLKHKLEDGDYTCVIADSEGIIFTSSKKGVAPLIDFYNNHYEPNKQYALADKVIGKGAIFLAKMCHITHIYAKVISHKALNQANQYHIPCEYDRLVDYIKNRNKDGQCPIEAAVEGLTDERQAYEAILKTIQTLMAKK